MAEVADARLRFDDVDVELAGIACVFSSMLFAVTVLFRRLDRLLLLFPLLPPLSATADAAALRSIYLASAAAPGCEYAIKLERRKETMLEFCCKFKLSSSEGGRRGWVIEDRQFSLGGSGGKVYTECKIDKAIYQDGMKAKGS